MKRKESRKEFLKRFGFNLLNSENPTKDIKIVTLSEEQADFLNSYSIWLEEFNDFVSKRNKEPFNIENNKRLMELSEEAEKRKPILENYMNDILFSTAFNHITKEITNEIGN